MEMVFGDQETIHSVYDSDEVFPSRLAAELIWNDVRNQIPNNIPYAKSFLRNITVYGKYYLDWSSYNYKEYRIACMGVVEDFMIEHADQYCYCLSYGDEDSRIEGVMEHGDIFKSLPHIKSEDR